MTLVWWHNANQGAGLKLWQKVAKEFHAAHPDVTIKRCPFQNEHCNDEDPDRPAVEQPARRLPELGRRRARRPGEGEARSPNMTKYVAPWIKNIGGVGRRLAGRTASSTRSRTASASSGSGTTRTLFTQAGITSPPTTWPQFIADVAKLKAADITPIAIGGKDRWPDAFYWDYLADEALQQGDDAAVGGHLQLQRLRAGSRPVSYVQQLLDAKPFQDGFLATPAQQGATSSAGLLGERQGRDGAAGPLEPGRDAAASRRTRRSRASSAGSRSRTCPGSKATAGLAARRR